MRSTSKILAVTLLVSVDAIIKAVSLSVLPGRDIVLIEGILSLRLTYNTGAAFSLMSGSPVFACALSAVLVIACGVYLMKSKTHVPMQLWLCAVTAGGLGNLIDRMLRGAVTDMIYLDLIDFPVFNFADICVTIGAAAFACAVLCSKEGDRV